LSHTAAHISKEDAPQSEHAAEAAKLGREALGAVGETAGLVKRDPLDSRQVLIKLEGLYDLLLKIEQFKREQPPEEDEIAIDQW
jgi:DNA topoisomerase 2-associated protein PAT1